MSARLVITIDTEEDSWGNWRSAKSTTYNLMQIPMIQEVFDRVGAIPTYLVNYSVIRDKDGSHKLSKILDKNRCEIGAHCHPWNTPPIEEELNQRNSMLCNLSYDLIRRKMESLQGAITMRFDYAPVCFRAGRWAFSSDVATVLQTLGYKIDTSITPLTDWTDEYGPDFSKAQISPYRFEPEKIFVPNRNGSILEVPPTIGFLQKNFRLCQKTRNGILNIYLKKLHLIGFLDWSRMMNLRWLSPENSTLNEMIQLAKNFIHNGHSILNMFFHSNSLLIRKTPFVRSEEDLKVFVERIEKFLEFCLTEGIRFSGLESLMDTFE